MSELEHQPSQKLSQAPELTGEAALDDGLLAATDANTAAQDADWFTLARKLRQRNRELLKRVTDLEAALAQMQDELDSEPSRPTTVASLALLPPEDALNNAQAQVNHLCQELEESHSLAQRQQFLIDSLTEQLAESQAQLEHWEREHRISQQRQSQQAELLSQATENVQILNRQLQRQQTQAVQFKTTLSECFTHAEVTADSTPAPAPQAAPIPQAPSQATPKPTAGDTPPAAVRPWSAPPQAATTATPPPTWATRMLPKSPVSAQPSRSPLPDPSQPAAPPTRIKADCPTRQVAPVGKFASLDLPAFNGESDMGTAPKTVLRVAQQKQLPPIIPVTTSKPNSTTKTLEALAAVNLPTFPRQA